MTTRGAHDPDGSEAHGGARSAGFWYAWWRGDSLPPLDPLPNFTVERIDDGERLARVTGLDSAAVASWLRGGSNHAYVGFVGEAPATWGWSAEGEVSISEIGRTFTLPPGNRYLWGFATHPAWRGRGLYPRLLQAVVEIERGDAERFWIGRAPGNDASERGILKAGFARIVEFVVPDDGSLGLVARGPAGRARAAAAVVGLPLLGGDTESSQ
ncbi:MAG TPA: GNAT family N-acetyltransferase [Ktedonobacterales bacterium]